MRDQAYFVAPPERPGPGVLLLSAWWGLTPPTRRRADELAEEGFTVLAPDLTFGDRPASEAEAEQALAEADPNRLASLVISSAGLVDEKSLPGAIGAVGFGMGGSLALWLSVRRSDSVAATVSFYGSQAIDFAGAHAEYQIHLADEDRFISPDEAAFMEATIGLEALPVTTHTYGGTRHGFADPESPSFDPTASELAWARTVEFLQSRLG